MQQEIIHTCKICGKEVSPEASHFSLSFNKIIVEDDAKKEPQQAGEILICDECGQEGMESVLHQLKLIHDFDTELGKKMEKIEKSVDILSLMKDYGIECEKVGVSNKYLARCPFHDQESSFLIDAKRKEYFCFCEGLEGDIFSFVINYDRDVKKYHTTLKQAVDFLMEKYAVQ